MVGLALGDRGLVSHAVVLPRRRIIDASSAADRVEPARDGPVAGRGLAIRGISLDQQQS